MNASSPSPVLLYAEDNKRIQISMVQMLEDAGFDLLVVDDGAAALDLLGSETGPIDGVVTDVNLGRGPTGWQVARCARRRSPTMPIVYASAVSEEEWMANGVPLSALVSKPFRPSHVIGTMRSLIGTAKARILVAVGRSWAA